MIAQGKPSSTANPGAALWAGYLKDLQAGRFTGLLGGFDKPSHNEAWGKAESASTRHGVQEAERMGWQPTPVEDTWFQFTEAYRFVLSNERAVAAGLSAFGDQSLIAFYDWFTDTSNDQGPRKIGGALYEGLKKIVTVRDAIAAVRQLKQACKGCV